MEIFDMHYKRSMIKARPYIGLGLIKKWEKTCLCNVCFIILSKSNLKVHLMDL